MRIKAIDIIRRKPVFPIKDIFRKFRGKRVWITGIVGSIGWSLAKHLVKCGAEVRGIDCNESRVAKVSAKTWWGKICPGFYTDIIPKGYDFVFHCAAFKHVRLAEFNREGYWRNNSLLLEKYLHELSVSSPGTVFVLCSTDKASGETEMGRSKLDAEGHVKFYGGRSVRLVNVAYSKGSVLDLWSTAKIHRICDGSVKRYWMQMEDAIYILCMTALQESGRYSVMNVPQFTMKEIQAAWEKEYGLRRWERFEMFHEALDEKLIRGDELLEPVNSCLGRIV